MANYWICAFLFRILLPAIIGTAILFRPSGLSALYLLLICYQPFVPVPTDVTMKGHSGIFLVILLVVSSVTLLCQVGFQVALLAMPPYAHFLQDCELLEKILRHVGFVRLDSLYVNDIIAWVSPEIIMFLSSVVFFVLFKKLVAPPENNVENETTETENTEDEIKTRKKYLIFFVGIGRYLVLIALCLAAVLRPSVQGGLYFVIFLSAATWWACYKQLRRGFAILLLCLLPIVFVHMGFLYAYQFQWPREFLDSNSTYARIFGLTPLRLSSCGNTTNSSDPRHFTWAHTEWTSYLNPFALYWLYYLLILEAGALLKPDLQKKQGTFRRLQGSLRGRVGRQVSQRVSQKQLMNSAASKARWQSATRKVRLIRGVSPSVRYGSGKSRKRGGLNQDSTGSITVTGENAEEIPLDEMDEDYAPSLIENIVYLLDMVLQWIIRVSYLGTNIIMMAWSITYISWATFVLLIWANLIWLIPNQRRNMLRSSPFLVAYAWILLISAYLYSMNLTDDELPETVNGVNLRQIGLSRVSEYPCNPLLVKCLYTVVFWITLRQYMQERMIDRQTSALADMVAPLQVSVGAATTGGNNQQDKTNSGNVMQKVGFLLNKFLTKFWIWIVAITLFAVAITGHRMTGFRIVYMALFLIFILSFQLSFTLWRKLMFGFWLTVIIFSMVVLVLTYTYQFDVLIVNNENNNFSYYWSHYLHIPLEQQKDIGLERFDTKELFVRLVTPTFFVIITVIQLHYFHKDFMELSDPKSTGTTNEDCNGDDDDDEMEQSSMQGGAVIDRTDRDDPTTSSVKYDMSDVSKVDFKYLLKKCLYRFNRFKNLTYLFLEIHMPKIVLFFAMLTCVYDKCAIYLVIVVFISLSLTLGRVVQVFAMYASSVIISLFLLARMLFQIKYIEPGNWNVTCEVHVQNTTENYTANIAEWLGFRKSNFLPDVVKWNILYILMVTLNSVIKIRQYFNRKSRGKPTIRAFFMFPRITRNDAEKDLTHMLKYLSNYGFYKFGVEMTLMATVALIGTRMDMYAVIYSIWLVCLYSLKRSTLSKVWIFYLLFAAIVLPAQYFISVGPPTTLCIEYPWDSLDILRRLQDWAYLPCHDYPPSAKKLILDFIVLLMVSRQWVVFRIEKRYQNNNYTGGSNDSIIHLAEDPEFKNPVPDFVTYIRSYLDVCKRGILMSFFWTTLAIVFLAGANRVNVFSIGYLIGAFVFLWQGSDIYLKPIHKIIRAWNWLLGYNVTVILLKMLFQILGCIFIGMIPASSCWPIQLLGIGCVRKFGSVEGVLEDSEDKCKVPRDFLGLFWDGLTFGFLITQKRIFYSYNFFHIINDTKARTILASRGAELIEELRIKRMREQEEHEHQILEKIKVKMDKIKANQQKMQDSLVEKPRYRKRQPKSNKEAIRSGDYYMFDDLEDEDLDLLPEQSEKDEKESDVPTLSEVGDAPAQRSVTIKEESPQPGTSKDEDISELSEAGKPSLGQRIATWMIFVWAFIESGLTSATNFLNRYSKDYRYVFRVLTQEKKILKEKTNYNIGLRMGSGQVWQPGGSYHSLLRESAKSSTQMDPELVPYEEEMSSYDQPVIMRFLLAVWFIIMSRSESLCYFIIFLYQAKTATFLSLPLPLMVFFWGTLTIPRPSKTFWITIIAYTECIVIIKCMFQLDVISWNEGQYLDNPFFPPRIIGVERKSNYAIWDLILLLVVFFHRVMLKSMGIWTSTTPTVAVLTEHEYKLENGQLVPVTSGSTSTPKNISRNDDFSKNDDSIDDSTSVRRRKHSTSSSREMSLNSRDETPCRVLPWSITLAMEKYAETFRTFMQQLLDPTSRVAADVYSLMFLCDFFNFFVILVGYSSFGSQQGDGGVASYLSENRVPPMFLFMLILQFMLIIIDRAIYLRKNILGKLIFQFIQIILLHIWLFVMFPIITEKQFITVIPPQIYYIVKCFYFLLSAYQIRCGYPSRILGNFLCKGYTMINMLLFKGFMLVPFLFELRSVMDWMWTETSMGVGDWLKMEDIFAHIFQLKCSRNLEEEYPHPRGQKRGHGMKYIMGGILLALIIGIIWFPLVFFSLGKAVGKSNIPTSFTMSIRIGPYEPVYTMAVQSNAIFTFTQADYSNLLHTFNFNKKAESFFLNYDPSDVGAIWLGQDSGQIWSISPPDRQRMIDELKSSKPVPVSLEYKLSNAEDDSSKFITSFIEIEMWPSTKENPNIDRENLLKMLQNQTSDPVKLIYLMPKFLKVTGKDATIIDGLLEETDKDPNTQDSSLRNLTLSLLTSQDGKEWWKAVEECDDVNFKKVLKNIPYQNCDRQLVIYTLNEKVFPQTLSVITGGGIIGLYTTIVLVASRVLRGLFAEGCFKIMFEDLPNVDRVLQLCLDVYLVREARELTLEEDLFAKLIFLFRSPETMIKWSRPKEELEDDENPEGDVE